MTATVRLTTGLSSRYWPPGIIWIGMSCILVTSVIGLRKFLPENAVILACCQTFWDIRALSLPEFICALQQQTVPASQQGCGLAMKA